MTFFDYKPADPSAPLPPVSFDVTQSDAKQKPPTPGMNLPWRNLLIAAGLAATCYVCPHLRLEPEPVHPDVQIVIDAYNKIGFHPAPSPRWTTYACQRAVADGHAFVGCQHDYDHTGKFPLWLVEDGVIYAVNEHAASEVGSRHFFKRLRDGTAPRLHPSPPAFDVGAVMRATQSYHLDERQ